MGGPGSHSSSPPAAHVPLAAPGAVASHEMSRSETGMPSGARLGVLEPTNSCRCATDSQPNFEVSAAPERLSRGISARGGHAEGLGGRGCGLTIGQETQPGRQRALLPPPPPPFDGCRNMMLDVDVGMQPSAGRSLQRSSSWKLSLSLQAAAARSAGCCRRRSCVPPSPRRPPAPSCAPSPPPPGMPAAAAAVVPLCRPLDQAAQLHRQSASCLLPLLPGCCHCCRCPCWPRPQTGRGCCPWAAPRP